MIRFRYCRACGYPAAARCNVCGGWRCRECLRLRRVPRSLGLYAVHCYPRHLYRMSNETAARMRELLARGAFKRVKHTVELPPEADELDPSEGGET